MVKRTAKKKPTVVGNQKQIKVIKSKLKKEPVMHADSTVVSAILSSTAVISHYDLLGGIGNGVAVSGQQASLKRIRIKGEIRAAANAALEDGRIDVLLDRDPVPGTVATYAQMYSPTTTTSIHGSIRPDAKNRFKILASIKGVFSNATQESIVFDRYVKVNLMVKSKTTTAASLFTQAEQIKNAILVCYWTTASSNQPTIKYLMSNIMIDDN